MDIQIENLQKKYNNTTVLHLPELKINTGELTGIVGNNGAGKTTLLRLILDLIKADNGEITIDGEKVHQGSKWKQHTGSFLDDGFLIPFLTPGEYFAFNARSYGNHAANLSDMLRSYEKFLGDEIMANKKYIRQLSTGNKQKTGIAAAMMLNPRLLLLDEPFNFLDPSSQIIIRNLLKWQNQQHQTTMLISSHNINHLAQICTRIILLEKGEIIKDIRPEDQPEMQSIENYFDHQAAT
ncbi:MAG: ABC transporter ATP-binding protein [Bacteroidota bacterium]